MTKLRYDKLYKIIKNELLYKIIAIYQFVWLINRLNENDFNDDADTNDDEFWKKNSSNIHLNLLNIHLNSLNIYLNSLNIYLNSLNI